MYGESKGVTVVVLGHLAQSFDSTLMAIQTHAVPALLVAVLVWFALESSRAGGVRTTLARTTPDSSDRAIAIVTERYARGEIDRSEYERLVTAFTR